MKLKICLLVLLCQFFRSAAQEGMKFTELAVLPAKGLVARLKPGDKVPDVLLDKVMGSSNRPLRLSGFRGQLLVIDFWATTCGACIDAMPRLDSLAEQFAGQLVVLPVTAEKAGVVRHFLDRNAVARGLKSFRTVYGDAVLGSLFPHRLLPHEVWISGEGTVLAITSVEEVNIANVRAALNGRAPQASEKADAMDYDRLKPLLVHGNGGNDTVYRYRSVMTGLLPGVQSAVSIRYDSLKRMTIVKATNVSARRLYGLVYREIRGFPDERVELGPVSPRGFYCYELDFPGANTGALKRKVREDLDSFFGVRSVLDNDIFRLLPADEAGGPLTL